MCDPQTYVARMLLLAGVIAVAGLPACASLKKAFGLQPEEDQRIVEMQRKLDRVTELNFNTKQKVEEIHERIVALQETTDHLKAGIDMLAGRQVDPERAARVDAAPEPDRPGESLKPEPDARPRAEGPHGPGLKKTGLNKTAAPAKISPEDQYNKAYDTYMKRHYDEALAGFRAFLQDYPKHDLADNSLYWIGEIYYDMEDYPNAIAAFKEVVGLYAEQSKAPDALLKIGYCYLKLDDVENARTHFEQVIKKYPFSETVAKASERLKELENR